MADNEEVKESTSRGNEWEVVSLTASAYAAAPGPKEDDSKSDDAYRGNDTDISRALFMSGHFVFPPSEHENLPIEPDTGEIQNEHAGGDFLSDSNKEGGARSSGKDEAEGFSEARVFDSKGNMSEFEEERNLHGLMSDKEQSICNDASFSYFHGQTALGGSTTLHDEQTDPSEQSLDYALEPEKDEDGLPCGAWWKRSAASLYAHAKDTNSFWSIFVAAAVMGLVILGQRYQQERWQALQLKWHLTVSSEKMSRILGPLSRLKDVIVGVHGHRQGSLIKYGVSTET
jgi:hypothetical protein